MKNPTKSFLYVIISTFLLVLGTYISGTILTPYARDLGATWFQIGILSGSMYVVRLILGKRIGKLADTKGSLAVLKYSLMLYPFISIMYLLSWNFYSLVFARLLHGIASAMMLPVGMAYVGHISPEGREGKYMSLYNLSVILASGIGPMLSTVIADCFQYKATFLALFTLAVISFFVIQFAHQNDMVDKKRPILEERIQEKTEYRLFGRNRQVINKDLIALSIANIALAVVSSLIGFFMVPFLESRGVELKHTGVFIAVYYFTSGLIQIPLGGLIDSYNKFYMILVSGFGTAAALILFPLTNNLLLLCLGMILTALTSSSFLTTVSSLSVLEGRKNGMGNTMGILNSVNSAGMIFGCISLGFLRGYGGSYNLFYYFSSIVMIISTVLFSVLWKQNR